MDLTAFPGGDPVEEGLADLARGVETIPALLVSIGAPRLRRIGLPVPEAYPTPEHRLYEKLAETGRWNGTSLASGLPALDRMISSPFAARSTSRWGQAEERSQLYPEPRTRYH